MRKRQIIGLAVAAVLCAGFVSCGGDDDDEPQNPIENSGSGSNGSGNSGNGGGLVGAVADAVDLGLPSGTLWASWNVGATKPEEYGGYYAWGETEEKEEYLVESYQYYDQTWEDFIDIGEEISGTEYDVAHVMWGDGWHMPTKSQIQELIDNCSWEWISYNGTINGYKVTGVNSNKIFIPAAGQREYVSLSDAGRGGYYWSSTLVEDWVYGGSTACILGFYDDVNRGVKVDHRSSGLSVRPVREK